MPVEDGERLRELLQEPRPAVPIRTPRRRVRQLKLRNVEAPPEVPPRTPERTSTKHLELLATLVELGDRLGCKVWVASDERGKEWNGRPLADTVLHEFPSVGLDPESAAYVRSIDVLWIRGKSIVAAFEVEATTPVFSGILRMSDLVSLQPNTTIDLFIVAPDERRTKVFGEITRPTFEQFDPPLRERCRYISASGLAACEDRTRPPLNKYLQPSVIREFAEDVIEESASVPGP
jgi:hypothetical protein